MENCIVSTSPGARSGGALEGSGSDGALEDAGGTCVFPASVLGLSHI